jgi:hypothetical protein
MPKKLPKKVIPKKEEVVPKKKTGMETYSFWVAELKKINAESPEKLQLSQQRRRKIVSELYPKIKGKTDAASKEKLRAKFRGIVKKLPKESIVCNPNSLPLKYFYEIEYFDVDNYILSLPDCLNVRINANIYGVTKIFNTRSYNYVRSGTQEIIEELRRYFPNSGEIYFDPIPTLKANKKEDVSKANNYFLDLVMMQRFVGKKPTNIVPKKETVKPISIKKPTSKIILEKQEKKKTVKRKPLSKKNDGFKIENKAKKEQILIDYNKSLKYFDKLFKMGAISKEAFISLKKEFTKEKNDAIKRLPK